MKYYKTLRWIGLLLMIPVMVFAEQARLTRSGIIIVGSGEHVRAFEPFRGSLDGGQGYADAVNRYKKTFGDAVNVYCMIIPTAVAIYCPDEAKEWTKDQRSTVRNIYGRLSDSVTAIDLFDTMDKHAGEDIYSRTDHHWAPLGAYYAAQQFASLAGVPFADLSTYEKHVIHDYVGTMYRFSRDAAVKNAPEDFVYYVPTDVDYTTTYIRYQLGKNRKVVSENAPEEGHFFYDYEDGSSAAYMTFMHGDLNTTKVKTSTRNGRRLLILKDSYGNAIPAYLFHSFEEIHVVDCRYFTKNIVHYVQKNDVTDILFANNAGHAYSAVTHQAYNRYLEQ